MIKIKIKIGTFDLGYRLCLCVKVGSYINAWRSPKLPLPMSMKSLKYLWKHRHAN